MWATNDHLGTMLYVRKHARDRWNERGEGDLLASLKIAVPFGMQKGESNILLAAGDMVFPVEYRGAMRVVVTCLTKEQALINIQNLGVRIAVPLRPEAPPDPEVVAQRQSAMEAAERLLQQSAAVVKNGTVEDLEKVEAEIIEVKGWVPDADRKKLMRVFNAVQQKLSQRRKLEGVKKHAVTQEQCIAALKRAVHEIVPSRAREIFERATVIREIMGTDIGQPAWHAMLERRERALAADRGLTTSATSAQ